MTPQTPSTLSSTAFTPAERRKLNALRRNSQFPDLFSEQEMARLRFVRWLYKTGRISS